MLKELENVYVHKDISQQMEVKMLILLITVNLVQKFHVHKEKFQILMVAGVLQKQLSEL